MTTANLLHGSANPIGGQNQVIKLRWGASPEAMKFEQAPPGIKFALGENVKQSNWSSSRNRYPQTRMGVDEIMNDAFRRAEEYSRRAGSRPGDGERAPMRVDLELEALAEVLHGKRWIHCHSYRQSEILALMNTCERFGSADWHATAHSRKATKSRTRCGNTRCHGFVVLRLVGL